MKRFVELTACRIPPIEEYEDALVKHAKRELQQAGFFDKASDYEGMLGESVMELISVFSKQGHSGCSANAVSNLFSTLSQFEVIGPLTGADEEWNEIRDGEFQNKRCSHVFKENGQAFDSQGKSFRDLNGLCWLNSDSRMEITFPYTPKTEIVDRRE